jgi:hypothetical protein
MLRDHHNVLFGWPAYLVSSFRLMGKSVDRFCDGVSH